MSTRMKVIIEVTTQEEIKAVMNALNITDEVEITEKVEKKETIVEDLKKRKDIADICSQGKGKVRKSIKTDSRSTTADGS